MPNKFAHTVLTVDDEEGILKALRRLLSGADIDVLTASGGDEALKLLSNNKVSLIISDQRMPGMTGVELLHRAREISPDTPRILLTGYADIEATVEAINSGAIRYYLNKPWDDDLLLSRITESLETYRITVENRRLTKLTHQQNRQLRELNRSLEQRVAAQTQKIRAQHDELMKSFMETIKAFSTVIELRFKETGSHSRRVALLVKKFLKHFDLNDKEIQDIVVSAFLHDIGKLSMPDIIHKKNPEDYSRKEMDIAAPHPILGQSFVYAISGFEEIGMIIRHHHEDYDGNGYPDKLTEKAIPFGSRIIRIADAFDHKAYMGGYPDMKCLNDAVAYLVQHSGTKFDPLIIKKFIEHDIARAYFHQETSDSDVAVIKPMHLAQNMVIADDVYTRSGLFVIPRGAKLSSGMIKRIIKIDKCDCITSGIKIYKTSVTEEDSNEKVPYTVG